MRCWTRRARRGKPVDPARGRLERSGKYLLLLAPLFLLFFLLFPGVAVSQETTLHSQSNVVVIPALVKSAKGEIVYGLAEKDFIVEEDDGVEQAAHLDEAADGQPVSMVVAVQRGRRANYEFPRIRGLSAMLDPLIGAGTGSVAIVEFDSQVQLAQDFTGNPNAIAETLKELQPGDGGAAILDAVDYSVKLLEKVPKERQRVLLLISETRDHGGQAKVEDVVEEIGQSNTTVYALAFSPSRSNVLDTMRGNNKAEMNPSPDLLAPLIMAAEAMKKNTPRTLASMTGGEYEMFATQKHFDLRMIDFTNHVHSRYLLSIEPKSPHEGLHQIRVRLRDAGDRVVLARSSYWAEGTNK
jgi:VWFA-related protein